MYYKKIKLAITLILLFSSFSFAQLAKESWSFTFGASYPKFVNHALSYASNLNYGGFAGLQRNFSEHVGLRIQSKAASMELASGTPPNFSHTVAISLGLDLVYYIVPLESVSPYLTAGIAPVIYFLNNPVNKTLNTTNFAYQVHTALGIEWTVENDWKLKTEFQYITVMDGKFDGSDKVTGGGVFGGPYNSYFAIDIGVNYYFSKGEPSKLGQLYDGIKIENPEKIDYDRIESIVKKYIPKEVVKQIVVEKQVERPDRWILVGVNFEFNSAKLMPEAYPILFYAVQNLVQNPDLIIEIQGYTDNIGSEKFNKLLSEKRANAVKEYLIARGISSSRLKTAGYGAANPVSDNKTAEGRGLNRRIEFKILK